MRSEAQRLEALAERLRAVEPMTPSPVAKIRAWNLVAASIEQSTSVRAPARSPWRLALAAAAAVALLVAGGVAASANSLPDSPLYPVKGALERAEGVLAFSPSDRLTYHLNLAQTRLTEAEAMIAGHRLDLAEQALADMNQELDDAAAVVSGERDMPAVAADMENRLQQAITAHDQQLAGMQAEVTNPTAQQAIAKARDRANQSLQALTVNPGNDNQANPSGQGQGQGSGKGPASPHPTAKK